VLATSVTGISTGVPRVTCAVKTATDGGANDPATCQSVVSVQIHNTSTRQEQYCRVHVPEREGLREACGWSVSDTSSAIDCDRHVQEHSTSSYRTRTAPALRFDRITCDSITITITITITLHTHHQYRRSSLAGVADIPNENENRLEGLRHESHTVMVNERGEALCSTVVVALAARLPTTIMPNTTTPINITLATEHCTEVLRINRIVGSTAAGQQERGAVEQSEAA
jgi:hypothetical protein